MIDIKLVRENPDKIKTVCANKKISVDVDEIVKLDNEFRDLNKQINDLNQARNSAAKEKNIEEGKRLKELCSDLQNKFDVTEKKLAAIMSLLPNIPTDDTPVGLTEKENVVLRVVGQKPEFKFEPKTHWEIGEALDLIDKEKASDVSGARFTYMKGDLVLMQYGLFQLALEVMTDRKALKKIIEKAGLDVSDNPFVPVVPPIMMRADVMQKMARLEPKEERYHIEQDDMYLIGSAEHTLGPMHMNETLHETELPLRYMAMTSAFRREAGTYGKDTKGILRLHQFEKTEMVSFSAPEKSMQEHLLMVAIQEHLNRLLELPYQVVLKCTADQGTPDARAVDIETWMPGEQQYRETHTADLMTDYQARRLNTKVKFANGDKEFVHMNDATVVAGRTLVAILENYQQDDGSVRVPSVLQKFVGKKIIEK
jgi:seryl-tRNA synthetase